MRFDLAKTAMSCLCIGVCLLVWTGLAAWSQAACTAKLLPEVEVGQGGLFLSDLLHPGSCPQLAAAAGKVRLGATPLAGSVRVLDGNEVRSLLERVPGAGPGAAAVTVPERIRVRRAGSRASCAELADSTFSKPGSEVPNGAPSKIKCDARILRGTPVEITARRWDANFGNWELLARCRHREDCLPFLIRVPSSELPATIFSAGALAETSPRKAMQAQSTLRNSGASPLVRRGQTAFLQWDELGIRVVVPSVSLDGGNEGDTVRARIARTGRVVRAIVTGAGQLRMAS